MSDFPEESAPDANVNVDAQPHSGSTKTDKSPADPAKKAKRQIRWTQGCMYLFAVATILYQASIHYERLYVPSAREAMMSALLFSVVLTVFGLFSGRSQYVLIAALALFSIDTAYNIAADVAFLPQRLALPEEQPLLFWGTDMTDYYFSLAIDGIWHIVRLYLIIEMWKGVKAFRVLRRT